MRDWTRHKRLCVPVMVKDFGQKGRGLVASKNFEVGDIIFKDTSVVNMNKARFVLSMQRSTEEYIKVVGEIYTQISTLSETDQKDFFDLSRSAKVDSFLSQHFNGSIPERDKRAYSIFENNLIASCDNKEGHLYLKGSLVNHSCDPNTLWDSPDLDDKKIELRAVKTIKFGEEVTTSYLDPYIAILGKRNEKMLELKNWNFQCKCESCLHPENEQIKKFRGEWNKIKLKEEKLNEKLNKLNEQEKLVQAINILDHHVNFIIKLDKPFLSLNYSSLKRYCQLADRGLEAGRHDLQKKGMSLLKKYLYTDFDKLLLRVGWNDEKRMLMNKIYSTIMDGQNS